MKNTKTIFAFAIVILFGVGIMTSCRNNVSEPPTEDTTDSLMIEEGEDEFLEAIDAYLLTIGSQYAPGEVCIPNYAVMAIDESGDDEIRVWGDWWVFNYNIAGDTLKCVSGGSHPGLMHLEQIKQNNIFEWVVSSFDQVEDGHGNEASARRIFGEHYDAFHAANSNQEARESIRLQMVSNYVHAHGLKVKYLQDHGWPAVALPE